MGIFNSLLDSVSAASTVALRLVTVYFTQFLPLGPRYLPIIYFSFIVYLVAVFIGYFSKSRRPHSTSRSLIILLGLYEPKRKLISLVAFSINCLTLLAALDFVFRPQVLGLGNNVSFSRLGYIDSTTARIVLRNPSASVVKLEYGIQDSSSTKSEIQIQTLLPESDFLTTFLLTNLLPNTSYIYYTNTTLSGTFHTSFPHPKLWSMLSTSCLKPGYPYRPLSSQLRIQGLEHLASYIQYSKRKMDFILFLGDFIYIDLPVRFGKSKESYRDAYRKVYASSSWTKGLRGIGWVSVYDDHEFENDWAANTTGIFRDAVGPWGEYQGGGNPDSEWVEGDNEGDMGRLKGKSWYTFSRGDIDFFVADARKYRDANEKEDVEGKSMLGKQQMDDLREWLESAKGWKVFVSSVPFTRNWRGPEEIDSWAGYLWERQRILELMWNNSGAVVISGDRHEHATTKFPSPPGKGDGKVIEFSTSPLSQFYQPFERTYSQVEESDVMVYSHPWGNSKFGVFEWDTRSEDRGEWKMKFELVVDGVRVWEKVIRYG